MRIRSPLALLLALAATPVAAQQPAPRSAPITNVRYALAFTHETAAERTVGVTMTFDAQGPAPVVLSLPAWTPGSYEIAEFARDVVGFSARSGGRDLRWDKTDPRTWRIFPAAAGTVEVTFRAIADSLDNAFAWARPDFLLVNGTNVFLYPAGQPLDFPSRVTVTTDPQWRVTTGMTPAGNGAWTAPTYHDLVDMPFFIGRFDLDSVRAGNVWVRVASYPAGYFAGEAHDRLEANLAKMFAPIGKVFGEIPFPTYTVMQIFDSSYGGASGLEHQNSHVDVITPEMAGNPFLDGLYPHEIFHAWNVKRLRPADLVPYRYDAVQATPWLWVSEGITDYYADLTLLRAGISDSAAFLATTEGKMREVEQAPPTALEDASLSTWVQPKDGTAQLYYPKGSLAGFLLDILVRDGSDNRAGLDDVLRTLYQETWKRGRGFTGEEWWGTVSRLAGGRSFAEFNAKYVDGREPYPWATVLPLAGLRLEADSVPQPRLGVRTRVDASGITVLDVQQGSTAALAGVQPGDLLSRIGDIEVTDPSFGLRYRNGYGATPGAAFDIVVQRDGQPVILHAVSRPSWDRRTRLALDPAAGAKAQRIRAGIFHGTTDRP